MSSAKRPAADGGTLDIMPRDEEMHCRRRAIAQARNGMANDLAYDWLCRPACSTLTATDRVSMPPP